VDERKGSAFLGLPAMIGLFAFVAFVGVIGLLGAIIAVVVFLLIIGAVVSTGKRRPNP
jgi:predicted PurR-regulated permease PerM